MPNVEKFHQNIEMQMAQVVGAPVSIGKITADWYGINPRLHFEHIRMTNRQGRETLAFNRVDGVVSWQSIFFAELRLKYLLIDQPELSIRQDINGKLNVVGIHVDGPSDDVDWLLRQGHVILKNARISWLDELHNKPLLPFEKVDLDWENSHGIHRFLFKASPPAFLSEPVTVQGELSGNSLSDLTAWRGNLSAEVKNFDAFAWAYWFDVPAEFSKASGNVKASLSIDHTGLRKVIADLQLHSLSARLGEKLLPMNVQQMNGVITWQELARGFDVSGKQLSLALDDGFVLPATDFSFHQLTAHERLLAETELQVDALDLANLRQLLPYLPLDVSLKQKIVDAAPEGKLAAVKLGWWGAPQDFKRYQLRAKFIGLGIKRSAELPGFSALTGEIDASEVGGTLLINSNRLQFDAPRYLLLPWSFDTLNLRAHWQPQKNIWTFVVDELQVANADLAGSASGRYSTGAKGLGVADINVKLSHATVSHVARYIPMQALGAETFAWLQKGLLSGDASEFNLKLQGNLDDFPFPENRKGQFQITAKAHDVGIEYAPSWPRIEKANVDLLIEGRRLVVNSERANIAGGALQNVSVTLPDILSRDLLLLINGESAGATKYALNYINSSPLLDALGGFTKSIKAIGDGKLNLQLHIPLSGPQPIKVNGSYHFNENEIDLGADIPTLKKVNGDLQFTERALSASNVNAYALDGPATLSIQTDAGGRLNVSAEGKVGAEGLMAAAKLDLAKKLYGAANWKTQVSVLGEDVSVIVQSDLVGLGSELPSPLAKTRHESVPLYFEIKNLSASRDKVTFHYGQALKAMLARQLDGHGNWAVKRGQINVGAGMNRAADRDGLWINGALPYVDLQDWLQLGMAESQPATTDLLPPIAGLELAIDKVSIYGMEINELKLNGQQRNKETFAAQLRSKEANGDVQWLAQGKGRLNIHLKNAALGARKQADVLNEAPVNQASAAVRKLKMPTVDVSIDQFSYRQRDLGKLDVHLSQNGSDVLLNYLKMTNPDGTLTASGKWDLAAAQTHAVFKLEIADAGKILDRSGYPSAVKDTQGTLNCDLNWAGRPDQFNLSNLTGTLQLKTGKGQFLKINQGAGKLLSVLNLQALPKRVTLDFTDVFSSGFEYDYMDASARIYQGVLITKDLKIEGSSALVEMAGQVDLKRETQNLRVRISPKLSNTVSLLAFAGGPVVGAGVLLVTKVLSDPLDKISSFEYNIAGSWSDPQVEKIVSGQIQSSSPTPQ